MLRNRIRGEIGQTMSEYAVVLGVITIGIVSAIGVLSEKIRVELLRVAGFFGVG